MSHRSRTLTIEIHEPDDMVLARVTYRPTEPGGARESETLFCGPYDDKTLDALTAAVRRVYLGEGQD